jgi:N-acetylmuramoyl-L-alanine amidase
MAKRALNPCLAVLVICGCLALITGCGTSPPPLATEPPPTPGYLGLQEEFGNLDFSPLKGRRIVVDPGHGGVFRGAVGPEGLTEAEVNLGVALYLRGLLEWAEATVHLTRTADYDFLTPADSSLTRDLMFRTEFADSLQPDVFVSIHHNSTASRDPDVNETQTYYPLGDEGASVDLARCIHRHLVLNLEITPAKILPGNFHVLRNATVPAVLGEPAMLSNPVMEGRLSLAASQELEAQAYFLGLLDYFSKGQPVWSSTSSDTLYLDPEEAAIEVSWVFLADKSPQISGPGPDPSATILTLDGIEQGFDLSADGHSLSWRPGLPLNPGQHLLHLTGRNLKGRATAPVSMVLMVDPRSRIEVKLSSESQEMSQSGRSLLHWHTSDGQPAPAGFLKISDLLRLPIPPRAQGWFLLPNGIPLDPGFEFQRRDDQSTTSLVPQILGQLPPGYQWRLFTIGEDPEFASFQLPRLNWRNRLLDRTGILHTMSRGGAPALVWQPGQEVWIEARGLMPLVDPGGEDPNRPTTMVSDRGVWRSRQVLPELFGRTIIVDPAGGGTDNDGMFPLGTRGADINLETARQVKLLLEGAGARVLLTREGEIAPDPQSKILLAGRENADLFLTIGQTDSSGQPAILHHPGSKVGVLWAQSLALAMAPLDSLVVGQSYAYLLRHTACPALEMRLRSPQTAPEELLASSLPQQMAVARAILLAFASVYSPTNEQPPTLDPAKFLGKLPGGLPAHTVDWARWDGNFSWLPPSFQNDTLSVISGDTPGWPAPEGMHTLEIHAGSQWQLWRVESTSEGLEFKKMMENR